MLYGAKHIIDLYNRDKMEIYIINGKNGVGKSSYANRLIAEVYHTINETGKQIPNWDTDLFKKHMGYHPKKVLQNWRDQKTRDYCYHWDDSGIWLSNVDYSNPLVKSIGKYLQVARTKYACIMFSCIDRADLLNKIRNFKSATIIDIIDNGDYTSKYPSERYRGIAKAWHYWSDRLDNIGTENDWEESFTNRMPDKFYNTWYLPQRIQYTKLAERMMWDKLRMQKDIMKHRMAEI